MDAIPRFFAKLQWLFCWPHWMLPDTLRSLLGEERLSSLLPDPPFWGVCFSLLINLLAGAAAYGVWRVLQGSDRRRGLVLIAAGLLPLAVLWGSASIRAREARRPAGILSGEAYVRFVELTGPAEDSSAIPGVLEVRRAGDELLFAACDFRTCGQKAALFDSRSVSNAAVPAPPGRWWSAAPLQPCQALVPVPLEVAGAWRSALEGVRPGVGHRLLAAAASPSSKVVTLAWAEPSPIAPAGRPADRIRLQFADLARRIVLADADLPAASLVLADGHWREGEIFLMPLRDSANTLLLASFPSH